MTTEELDQARADKAMIIYVDGDGGGSISCIAARLAREGWTPPVVVDPDIAEAWDLVGLKSGFDNHALVLSAIKRGRALAAAEAKPGIVWVKHDRSAKCPVHAESYVWLKTRQGTFVHRAGSTAWSVVTHYAIITPPEDK